MRRTPSTPLSSGFARLACGSFYEAVDYSHILDFFGIIKNRHRASGQYYSKEVNMRCYINCFSAKGILFGLIIVFSLVSFSGCTRYVWYHHDQKEPLNFQKDKLKCEDDVAIYRDDAGKPADKTVIRNRMNDCMKALGYGWGPVGEAPDDCFIYEDNR
jgi:hypothetical protein